MLRKQLEKREVLFLGFAFIEVVAFPVIIGIGWNGKGCKDPLPR